LGPNATGQTGLIKKKQEPKKRRRTPSGVWGKSANVFTDQTEESPHRGNVKHGQTTRRSENKGESDRKRHLRCETTSTKLPMKTATNGVGRKLEGRERKKKRNLVQKDPPSSMGETQSFIPHQTEDPGKWMGTLGEGVKQWGPGVV